MLQERIQEILEFTKSESPYRKANKGWLNQDIFLDLNPSSDNLKQTNEAVKVTLLWSPISSLLSNIFLIIIISSLLVFTSLSFVKGRFDFNLINTSMIKNFVITEENKVENTSHLNSGESLNLKIEQNIDTNELDKSTGINVLDEIQMNSDQKITSDKIDIKVSEIKEAEKKKDNEILKDKKSKSNFI